MVQNDFFDIIDEDEDFEPQRGLTTGLLLLGTVFMVASFVLLAIVRNSLGLKMLFIF